MRPAPLNWVVALDGGTTNTRARLLHEGRVVATARRGVGVRDAVGDPAARPLTAAVRDVVREVLAAAGGVRPDAIVAAGMLTSEVGLVTVPHAVAPAGLDDLARGAAAVELPEVTDRPILFVPGVRTPPAGGRDGWAEADVMRGEECESLGARSALGAGGPIALVWPGSHTKLVATDGAGRVVGSHTTLAGELTAALARHTLMAASLPETLPDAPDPDAAEAGARLVASGGLGRAAFLVRVAALTGALTAERRAAFWVGAVVADDAAHLARHPILRDAPALPVWVGGRRPQRGLYADHLARFHAGPVQALDDATAEAASALGALAVARRHAELLARGELSHPPRGGRVARGIP
jgi:2-dehydro-3-deoxygalactonokinase